jgi:hypothetical protein
LLNRSGAWVQFNGVGFEKRQYKTVTARVRSKTGGVLDVNLGEANRQAVARLEIPKSAEWKSVSARLRKSPEGVRALIVSLQDNAEVEVDWISFE